MGDLADGNTKPAADKIESVLGEGIPLVLDLLAKLIGVNVAAGVRAVIDKARDWVANALKKVIKSILGMFKGGKKDGKGEAGAKEEEKPGAAKGGGMPDELIPPVPITYEGGNHTLQFDVIGGKVELMMHTDPVPGSDLNGVEETEVSKAERLGRDLAALWQKYLTATATKAREDIKKKDIDPLQKQAIAAVKEIKTDAEVTEPIAIAPYDELPTVSGKENHHVPPKGVMNWVGAQAAEAVEDIGGALPKEFRWLQTLAEEADAEHKRDGPRLAAVAVAASTHIKRDKENPDRDVWRIHWGTRTSEETRKEMSRRKEAKEEIAVIERKRLEDLQPAELTKSARQAAASSGRDGAEVDRMSPEEKIAFIREATGREAEGEASTQFFGSELDRAKVRATASRGGKAPVQVEEKIEAFIADVGLVVRSARIQSHSSVEVALRNSKVDGNPDINLAALNTILAPLEVRTWHQITGMDKLRAF